MLHYILAYNLLKLFSRALPIQAAHPAFLLIHRSKNHSFSVPPHFYVYLLLFSAQSLSNRNLLHSRNIFLSTLAVTFSATAVTASDVPSPAAPPIGFDKGAAGVPAIAIVTTLSTAHPTPDDI